MLQRTRPTDALLATDPDLLDQRASRSTVVNLGSKGLAVLVTYGRVAMLSRLLTPTDFGLVGMVVAFTGLMEALRDAGLSFATIQARTITVLQLSMLFWCNLGLSALFAIGLALGAPLIAKFYGDTEVSRLAVAVSVVFLISGVRIQHLAILRRNLRFGELQTCNLAGLILGSAGGVVASLLGLGYWSLVVALVIQETVVTATVFWFVPWRPLPLRFDGEIRHLLAFGGKVTLAGFLNQSTNSYISIAVGRVFGALTLGQFQRAMIVLVGPIKQVLPPIGTVAVSALARTQGNPERYLEQFERHFCLLLLICCPVGVVGFLFSSQIVQLLLGPQWTLAADLVSVLSLLTLSMPAVSGAGWLFVSQGRGNDLVIWNFFDTLVLVGAITLGCLWSVTAVAYGLAIAGILKLPIMFYLAGRQGHVASTYLWRNLAVAVVGWGAGAGFGWMLINLTMTQASLPHSILLMVTTATVCAGTMLLDPRTRRAVFGFVMSLSRSSEVQP